LEEENLHREALCSEKAKRGNNLRMATEVMYQLT
jgi:hypothetical protein